MDNYKILNSYTNKIIKLLNELGYAWVPTTNDSEASLLKSHWIIAESSGDIAYSSTDSFYEQDSYKELTFAELSDLVVLKRNDINDATHTDGNRKAFLDSAGEYHYWCFHKNEWIDSKHIAYLIQYLKPIQTAQAVLNDLDELREEYKDYHKDPALISGAEAKLAWAKGENVQFRDEFDKWYEDWADLNSKKNGFWITDFDLPHHQFRIKPTLTVNAELPKPAREFQLNTEVYAVTYEFKTREERNAFADKLRGTNS